MRITNKIIQNNSLSNLNMNKILEDKYNTQMATGKKITRPSEDPVIAIRALRLRSTLADVTQFRDKNAEDADSWLTVTEDTINSVIESLEKMIEECNTGANKKWESIDKQTMIDSLKELREGIYASGDADYAGRNIFTGYRTSTKLRFQEDDNKTSYDITEKITKAVMEDIIYVKARDGADTLDSLNAGNYDTTVFDETDVYQETVHRIRLSYSDLSPDTMPKVQYYGFDATGMIVAKDLPIAVISQNGEMLYDETGAPVAPNTMEDPYLYAQGKKDAAGNDAPYAVFIPETGELILNDKAYAEMNMTRDYANTKDVNEGQISITYTKNNWKEGDLKPQHYFECTERTPDGKTIEHNKDQDVNDQIIAYDVGFNQSVRVNTLASDVFTHDIGRDVDDMISILEQVQNMESTISTLETIKKGLDPNTDKAKYEAAEKNLAAANKALTFLGEKLQKTFEHGISQMQGHHDKAKLEMTAVGTRSSKLELVKTRLDSQKSNFKDLVKDNDQVDTAEAATNLAQVKLAYDGALMATGKITENSLLNFV